MPAAGGAGGTTPARRRPLEHRGSTVATRSPWWIDYNHAPPGAGYLHMLMGLNTTGPQGEAVREASGPEPLHRGRVRHGPPERGVHAGAPGRAADRGAGMVLLVQGAVDGITSGWALTGQPFHVRPGLTRQTVRLVPDEGQWTALGSRQGREDMYGVKPLERVLAEVNTNILLIMFPLTVEPMGPLDGDPNRLRPERDYPVWRRALPEGYIVVDEVELAFA